MRALVVLLALAVASPVAAAESGAALIAARLEGEEAECSYLLFLCKLAHGARDRQANTPAGAEMLAFKRDREAELSVQDAVAAARVIRTKHGGKSLDCFAECDVLDEAAR
ncbi:MAG TPA: hypothetical protein VKA21_14080 [Candidatus Binatia bacterium]|nr:hypothetical protein [Candidatus Binatia bacterium]